MSVHSIESDIVEINMSDIDYSSDSSYDEIYELSGAYDDNEITLKNLSLKNKKLRPIPPKIIKKKSNIIYKLVTDDKSGSGEHINYDNTNLIKDKNDVDGAKSNNYNDIIINSQNVNHLYLIMSQ